MQLIFWQNILSIHQQPLLEAVASLPGVDKVLLIVEQEMTPERRKMGWSVPKMNGVDVYVAPSGTEITRLIQEHPDAVNIMGGIGVSPMLSTALHQLIQRKARLGIMAEPFNAAGIKGLLRKYKYTWYRLRYFKHIQFFLAIGKAGWQQYAGLGFNKNRVFPWAYFIDVPKSQSTETNTERRKLMYAGRIEPGKGICNFVAELANFDKKNYSLDIYGSGPDEDKIKEIIQRHDLGDVIHFHSFMPHDQLLQEYAQYDWILLPSSAKDGWGVVVSEGLLFGLKGLTSNICGVSWAIKNGVNGVTFDWSVPGSLAQAIDQMLHSDNFSSRSEISAWANNALTGHAGAQYLQDILENVYNNGSTPHTPFI